ncbi:MULTISPECIES: histidinol-phosphate transaminase [unclassified Exiguobacterium]|uniref:pyridoxal phosphate-dependent aminotransferase n=1 Tax=unclassified Exiguobacterium TaxID=2644629 RepID=UPI001BE56B52|nr:MULTISPECIES: histidinol-phosphate transaminase [unclassified Exiguobacterium]
MRLHQNERFTAHSTVGIETIKQLVETFPLNEYPVEIIDQVKTSYSTYAGVRPTQLVAGNGSDELIGYLCARYAGPESPVIASQPDFVMYQFYADRARGDFSKVPLLDGMALDVDGLIEAPGNIIFISHPHNPSGILRKEADVRRLLDSGKYVVIDEAYIDFALEQSMVGLLEEYPNAIILRTLSKAFGLASLRLGFLIASEAIVAEVEQIKSPYNVSGLSAAVGIAIMAEPELDLVLAETYASRDTIARLVEPLGTTYPSAANFVYVEYDEAERFTERCAKAGLRIRLFDGAFRISCGSVEAMNVLERCVEEEMQCVVGQANE